MFSAAFAFDLEATHQQRLRSIALARHIGLDARAMVDDGIPEKLAARVADTEDRCFGQLGIRPGLLPAIILVAPRLEACFGGAHGLCLAPLVALCRYDYYQIIWHEMLHQCFDLDDCYHLGSKLPSCDLATCIMQYEPSRSSPGSGEWLCSSARERLLACSRSDG